LDFERRNAKGLWREILPALRQADQGGQMKFMASCVFVFAIIYSVKAAQAESMLDKSWYLFGAILMVYWLACNIKEVAK
jgi:hypothetical protein